MLLWRIRNFHLCLQNDSIEKAMPAFVILIANLVQDFNTFPLRKKNCHSFHCPFFFICTGWSHTGMICHLKRENKKHPVTKHLLFDPKKRIKPLPRGWMVNIWGKWGFEWLKRFSGWYTWNKSTQVLWPVVSVMFKKKLYVTIHLH